jgi:hypothetical protein
VQQGRRLGCPFDPAVGESWHLIFFISMNRHVSISIIVSMQAFDG